MKITTTHKTIIIIFLLSVAFSIGWLARSWDTDKTYRSSSMRLSGFTFVKPLLVCDTSTQRAYPELKILQEKITTAIKEEKNKENLQEVSIYFQDFKTDGRIDINPQEQFNAASIGKVAVMIAFFRMAESNPAILEQKIQNTNSKDLNANQEIKPKEYAVYGKTYSVNELIEKMVRYSDNNALFLLASVVNPETFKAIYQNLQLPINFGQSNDKVTTKDISYFFRVLYNGTYLTNELSEEGLKLLSTTDFNSGIVSGVAKEVTTSHKFGSESYGKEHQLHDCGIIYHANNPYLLCIMTKSSADITSIESAIQHISSAVYQQVNSYSK